MKTKMKKILAVLLTAVLVSLLIPASGPLYAQTTSSQFAFGADTVEPRDIDNLSAAAGDGEVNLIWSPATDNTAVIGYKIYRGTNSVQNENDLYNLPNITVGNITNYTIRDLTNDQTYYFAVTALDAANNESINYSNEANATPRAGLQSDSTPDNGMPPQLQSVQSEDIVTVKVVFSEPMRLPEEQPASAFSVEKITDRSRLTVQNAEIDSRDTTGATVILTTAPQEPNAEYLLTAGIELQDYRGNPIISGTSDTGSFRGSAVQRARPTAPPLPQEQAQTFSFPIAEATTQGTTTSDSTPPAITSAAADLDNRISVVFSERIRLPQNPISQFSIRKKNSSLTLNIINVSLSVDGLTAYITTGPQELAEYDVSVSGVTDEAGNPLAAQNNPITVTGRGSLRDLVPPEDITRLVARIKDAQRNIVELQWQGSTNTAGDLVNQLLYQSNDRNGRRFAAPTSLGTSTNNVEVHDLRQGNWYTFKITTKDTSNNESRGVATSIFLPRTGPGMIAAGLTALFMGLYSRRKKR